MPYKDPEKRRIYIRDYKRRVYGYKPRQPVDKEAAYARTRERIKAWQKNNPDKILAYRRKAQSREKAEGHIKGRTRRHQLRRDVIDMYGGKCKCCKTEEFFFLTVAFMEGGGAKERAKHSTYSTFMRWLRKERRQGVFILCFNCNKARSTYGRCPHKNGVKLETCNSKTVHNSSSRKTLVSQKWRHSLRERVVELYGGQCAECGESEFKFLAIDHVNGAGTKHIRSFKNYPMYLRWLAERQRSGFQILCHNCNAAKARKAV
jgi:hypothetical protein